MFQEYKSLTSRKLCAGRALESLNAAFWDVVCSCLVREDSDIASPTQYTPLQSREHLQSSLNRPKKAYYRPSAFEHCCVGDTRTLLLVHTLAIVANTTSKKPETDESGMHGDVGYRKILKRNVFEMSLAHNEIKKVTPSYALLVTKRRYFKFLVHKLYRGFFRGYPFFRKL